MLQCHVMLKNITMSCYVEECARDLGVVPRSLLICLHNSDYILTLVIY